MLEIVSSMGFRVIEDSVRIMDLAEPVSVAALLIVGMKALCEQSEDPLDRVRLRTWTDLQRFVVVGYGGRGFGHGADEDRAFYWGRAIMPNPSGRCPH